MMQHLPTCPGVDLFETVGSRGDSMIRCRGCGRFTLAGVQVGSDYPPAQPAGVIPRVSPAQGRRPQPTAIPPATGPANRRGDRWPTHRAKAQSKRFNRRKAIREAAA